MKIIKPVEFQDSMLISTTAANADSDWSSVTTYTIGQIVTYNSNRYESLQNSNLNKVPTSNPTWWLKLGADNKHAMFDNVVGTSTVATTSLEVVFKPGVVIDTVALINVNADIVTIEITDGLGGPVVYTETAGLSGAVINNWYDYFFIDPLLKRTQIIFGNIPPYLNAYVKVTLTSSAGSQVSVALCSFGMLYQVGQTEYGATAGIIDYSIKQTDEFGNINFVERAYSKRMSANVFVPNNEINRVQNLLYSVRAKPSVWIASDDPTYEEPLVIFGFYKEFSTTISYPTYSMLSLDIEGLT